MSNTNITTIFKSYRC